MVEISGCGGRVEDSEGAQSAPGAGADTPAMVLGLTGATAADAYLELQMEEMRQRNPYEISHFRLRRFNGWGEALAYAGKPTEAKAQFARAAQLDLTPSEKSELSRQQQLGKTT
ncbi:MAG: hypothetical protein JWO88_3723 [Frankiales bacterium]|nr:hypothetical protein [Frankiales bacterium]